MIEEWERQRKCVGETGSWWDSDASESEHRTAAWVCNRRCPVKDRCREQAERQKRPVGLYAGLMWGDPSGPRTVEKWHAIHTGVRAPQPDKPRADDVIGERVCAWWKCDVIFPVSGRHPEKRYHSARCSGSGRKENSRAREKACAGT